jgi:hypothetical protein
MLSLSISPGSESEPIGNAPFAFVPLDVPRVPNPLPLHSDLTVANSIYNDKFDLGNYLSL